MGPTDSTGRTGRAPMLVVTEAGPGLAEAATTDGRLGMEL
jgi:hypothetical protein